MKDRALALAGLLQAVHLVQQMARSGESESRPLAASIESLFRFDAPSVEDVFGGIGNLETGLQRLLTQLEGGAGRDAALTRMAMTVLQLERRFVAHPTAADAVRRGLEDIGRGREPERPHPALLARLGELYAKEISPIGPRVLVQGNPVYLARQDLVADVRATLLAAVRAAVLWRQLGGSYWDFVLRRRALVEATREALESPR
jgi:high frequency lysogenization protein